MIERPLNATEQAVLLIEPAAALCRSYNLVDVATLSIAISLKRLVDSLIPAAGSRDYPPLIREIMNAVDDLSHNHAHRMKP